MLTCDITPTKHIKLNMPVLKPNGRQRDPDAFRLMWHNREVYIFLSILIILLEIVWSF
jgi:hypothetical protein